MGDPVIIAIDAMGGDAAPAMVIDGLKLARERVPEARYLLFGCLLYTSPSPRD